MKQLNKFFMFCLMLLMTVCFSHAAFAAKTLSLSRNISVNNTGDDTDRTAILDITLTSDDDVNGLVFTLKYDPAVFTFEGLEKGDIEIDDGSAYDPSSPPDAETIAATLYYQFNNKPAEGIVMIAAAAANFFTAEFVAFKVKFKVKPGLGDGDYAIGIQKTIIGPDTAANAGYTEDTALDVAAGIDPSSDPTTAQTYAVEFVSGLITVFDLNDDDQDDDGINDQWEIDFFGDLMTVNGTSDYDQDGYLDIVEYENNTDPFTQGPPGGYGYNQRTDNRISKSIPAINLLLLN